MLPVLRMGVPGSLCQDNSNNNNCKELSQYKYHSHFCTKLYFIVLKNFIVFKNFKHISLYSCMRNEKFEYKQVFLFESNKETSKKKHVEKII